MIGGAVNRSALLVAIAVPGVCLLGALALALFAGDVETVAPSDTAFAAWQGDRYDPVAAEPVLLERPLLWSSRRPLAPLPQQPQSATAADSGPVRDALAGYRLAGMFSSEFDAGVIVVGPKERKRLVVGEEIDGWMLEDVQGDAAVFVSRSRSAGARRVTLQLEHMLAGGGNAQPGKTSSRARTRTTKEPEGAR